jgi:hypothetical protein
MRHVFSIVLFSLLSSITAFGQTIPQLPPPPPLPSNFNPTAPAPKKLPAKLNIPANTRLEVKGARKVPIYRPPEANAQRLLFSPDLVSAVIERGARDVHATFNWEGGHSSETFIVHGVGFRTASLAFPNSVTVTSPYIEFQLGAGYSNEGEGGDFPSVAWYSPSTFAGKATINGNSVLVFAQIGANPKATSYPDGDSVCLDASTLLPVWIADGRFVYTITYIPAPNVQIEPKGMMLSVIQRQLGHYP